MNNANALAFAKIKYVVDWDIALYQKHYGKF
jgi:hypothetical protein